MAPPSAPRRVNGRPRHAFCPGVCHSVTWSNRFFTDVCACVDHSAWTTLRPECPFVPSGRTHAPYEITTFYAVSAAPPAIGP
jgi:hypothetical protein